MRVVAELITQDAEGAGGIAEAAGDIDGGLRTGAAGETEGTRKKFWLPDVVN